jgi:hypothetical protein
MPANTANQNARALLAGILASMEGRRESATNAGAGVFASMEGGRVIVRRAEAGVLASMEGERVITLSKKLFSYSNNF